LGHFRVLLDFFAQRCNAVFGWEKAEVYRGVDQDINVTQTPLFDVSFAPDYATTFFTDIGAGELIVVGPTPLRYNQAIRWMGELHIDPYFAETLSGAARHIRSNILSPSLVLVSLDDCPDIYMAVDALLSFRKEFPNVAVMLTSENVTTNDFSCERLAIADVTLKEPLTLFALEFGLVEAVVNCGVWQASCNAADLDADCVALDHSVPAASDQRNITRAA
jgi:hypothetical protein